MFLTSFGDGRAVQTARHLTDVGNAHRGAPTIFTHTASLSKGNTMSTVITGASGHLGRLVVDQLLAAGTSPARIVATGRDAGKLADLAQNGVTVRRADFADPSTLDEAFAGADAMLLVSTTTVGERFDNARNAIDAAARAGVSRIVYTSIVNASTAQMTLADAASPHRGLPA